MAKDKALNNAGSSSGVAASPPAPMEAKAAVSDSVPKGRLEVFNENFPAADQKLSYVLMHCNPRREANIRHVFATLSFIAELFIFLYVGMDALDIEKWRFVNDSPGTSVAVSFTLLGLILIGRTSFVFPLSILSNLSKDENISFFLT